MYWFQDWVGGTRRIAMTSLLTIATTLRKSSCVRSPMGSTDFQTIWIGRHLLGLPSTALCHRNIWRWLHPKGKIFPQMLCPNLLKVLKPLAIPYFAMRTFSAGLSPSYKATERVDRLRNLLLNLTRTIVMIQRMVLRLSINHVKRVAFLMTAKSARLLASTATLMKSSKINQTKMKKLPRCIGLIIVRMIR